MTWKEFASLLSGLGEGTPLARTVAIRLEKDQERINDFSSAQYRIWSKWRNKAAQRVPEADRNAAAEYFKQMFMKMAQ